MLKKAAKSLAIVAVLLCSSLLMIGINADAMTLKEAFRSAMKNNEQIASQFENVRQAEERYSQAKGALFPTVNGVATYARQDNPPAGTASNISPSEQKTVKLTVAQPLFRGMREWALLKQQKTESEAADLSRNQFVLQAYSDIAANFYLVLMAEQDLKNLQSSLEVNQKRLGELQGFRRLGKTRASEVLSQEASMSTLEAQLDAAQFTVENSRAALALLTGLSRKETLNDSEVVPGSVQGLESYLSRVEERPDVKAAKKAVESSDQGISIARGGHLPSLDLSGNYYFLRPSGYLKDVKWDLQLSLTFPIFQGGVVKSATEIAVSQMKQSELELSRIRRTATEEIETYYQLVKNDLSQIEKQRRAFELNERNYQAERQDYRNGLVNNIEVLSAMTAAQETRRNLDKIQFQYKIDYMRLMAATAQLKD